MCGNAPQGGTNSIFSSASQHPSAGPAVKSSYLSFAAHLALAFRMVGRRNFPLRSPWVKSPMVARLVHSQPTRVGVLRPGGGNLSPLLIYVHIPPCLDAPVVRFGSTVGALGRLSSCGMFPPDCRVAPLPNLSGISRCGYTSQRVAGRNDRRPTSGTRDRSGPWDPPPTRAPLAEPLRLWLPVRAARTRKRRSLRLHPVGASRDARGPSSGGKESFGPQVPPSSDDAAAIQPVNRAPLAFS